MLLDSALTDAPYRLAPIVRFPLGARGAMVYLPVQQRIVLLGKRDVELLAHSQERRSLDASLDLALRQQAPDQAWSIRRLEEFVDMGVLLSNDDLLRAAIRDDAEVETNSRITWMAIPTHSRPAALARALRSYIANLRQFERSVPFLLADDSGSSDSERTTRELTRRFATDAQVRFFFAGQQQKSRFISDLAETGGIPEGVLRFALFGLGDRLATFGANRNAILLHTAGDLMFSVDDDTVCQTATVAAPANPPALTIGNESERVEYWFFENADSARQFVSFKDMDIVGEHERLLGLRVRSAVRSCIVLDGGVDLSKACSHLVRSLLAQRGRVMITLNGAVGDSGMVSPLGLLMLDSRPTRERLIASERSYRTANHSRIIVRQSIVRAIAHVNAFTACAMGLDNRDLLPPFFPVCAGEDDIFAATLRGCVDQSYCGHIPFCLLHAPFQDRSYVAGREATVYVADILMACIHAWTPWIGVRSPTQRLRSLGQYLVDLSSLEQSEFDEVIRILLLQSASESIVEMDSLLRQQGYTPRYWADELQQKARALELAVLNSTYTMPVDLAACFPPEQIPQLVRKLIGQFGELLRWWPAIIEAAKSLKARGHTFGEEIERVAPV